MKTKAALFRRINEPLSVEEISVDAPGPNEILVRTVASGVCHSDLHFIEGLARLPLDLPTAMGHEGAGVVEAVGENIVGINVGDHVVASLSGFCGACPQCLSGHPNVCSQSSPIKDRPASRPPRLSKGQTPVLQFSGVSSHAGYMLLHEHSAVKIDRDIPLEAAALLSCGALTGLGAVLHTAAVRPGETVAVLGCGGVGLAAVQGARLGGARRIIAVDRYEEKLKMAERLGATDVVNASEVNVVEAVRDLTGGLGVDHALEVVGLPSLVRQAVECLAVRGTATVVGVPPAGSVFEIPSAAMRPECKLQTSRMGSTRFRIDIPRYLEWYQQGRLHLDEMISHRCSLDDIESGFVAMRAGDGARTVVTFS